MREKITQILEYQILKVGSYSITPFEILSLVLIYFFTRLFLSFVQRYFKREIKRGRFDEGRAHSIFKIIKYFTWIVTIVYCLDIVGIKITFLLAGSAALLVGIGLGIQQTFNDFVSGMILLFEGTVKPGDIIQLQDGTVGRVQEIHMRVSEIQTRENISIIIPNSKLINDSVINWSHNTKLTRFAIKIGVSYGSNVPLVKSTLEDAAALCQKISSQNKPVARFQDFGNSSLDFELLFWCDKTFEIEFIRSEIRYHIERLFREKNIIIPFPQRDLHIKSSDIKLS